jgi:Family of unknown function (DUF6232)/GYF domain 2
MKKYFYNDGENHYGPFSVEELKSHNIDKTTMIWKEGWTDWKEASEDDDINVIFVNPPPIKKTVAPPPIKSEVIKNPDIVERKKQEEAEKTYYTNDLGIRITNTRLIVNDSTYPVNGITAVHRHQESTTNKSYLIISLLGVFFMLMGREGVQLGLFLIVIGIALFIKFGNKTKYSLQIKTLAGDIDIFENENKKLVQEVYAAINNSIIQRG